MENEIFDLESLVDLEQQFFDEGYKEGFAHGQEQGLEEGRQLGIEKGFEIWEEIGFYEGFAKVCRAHFEKKADNEKARAIHTATVLIDLIDKFPQHNPSPNDPSGDSEEIDLIKLLNQIRSRYKMLCSSIGAQPSLRANSKTLASSTSLKGKQEEWEESGEVLEGQMSASRSERKKVWPVDVSRNRDLEF